MNVEIMAGSLPETHPAMLVVKLAGDPATAARALATADADRSGVTDGVALLGELQRQGRVRDVLPLVPAATAPAGPGGLGPLAQTGGTSGESAASIVRVTDEEDVGRLLPALRDDPKVDFASQVPVRWVAVQPIAPAPALAGPVSNSPVPNSPVPLWNLQRISWPRLRELGNVQDGGQVRVGVLDTGVDETHPDLAGALDGYVWGGPSLSGQVSPRDLVGHGTHVSGIVSARYSPSMGTQGVSRARLRVWKIFDDAPDLIASKGVFWYLVDPVLYRRALADCVEHVDVVNLSIGGTQQPDPQESLLFRALADRGVPVIAAMGNERSLGSPTSYPAAVPGVIAVGATGPQDEVGTFSNSGQHISLSAPGVSIWSTMPGYPGQWGFRAITGPDGRSAQGSPITRELRYAAQSGTSMASPTVTAAAALALANSASGPAPDTLRYWLMASADRLPTMGSQSWTADVGTGRLNVHRLLLAAKRLRS